MTCCCEVMLFWLDNNFNVSAQTIQSDIIYVSKSNPIYICIYNVCIFSYISTNLHTYTIFISPIWHNQHNSDMLPVVWQTHRIESSFEPYVYSVHIHVRSPCTRQTISWHIISNIDNKTDVDVHV